MAPSSRMARLGLVAGWGRGVQISQSWAAATPSYTQPGPEDAPSPFFSRNHRNSGGHLCVHERRGAGSAAGDRMAERADTLAPPAQLEKHGGRSKQKAREVMESSRRFTRFDPITVRAAARLLRFAEAYGLSRAGTRAYLQELTLLERHAGADAHRGLERLARRRTVPGGPGLPVPIRRIRIRVQPSLAQPGADTVAPGGRGRRGTGCCAPDPA